VRITFEFCELSFDTRLLRPLLVVNEYAPKLGFVDGRTRTRRDHAKYLTLIDTIALLHQHQRPVKTVEVDGQVLEYIEVTPADIRLGNELSAEVLGRSLDEMPPQTRRVLEVVHGWARGRCEVEGGSLSELRFSRREVREVLGMSAEQVRVHVDRLVELEYVAVHRGRTGQSFVYELADDGEGAAGGRFVLGLLAPNLPGSNGNLPGSSGNLPGWYRAQTGPLPAGYRTSEAHGSGLETRRSVRFPKSEAETHRGPYANGAAAPNGS
jgi:hypothetical protein